jgi:hypothetical protein
VSLLDTVGGAPGARTASVSGTRRCRLGRVTRCALGAIPAGESVAVTVRARSRGGGRLRNVATVVAGQRLAAAAEASARASARVTQAAPTRRPVPVTG